MPTAPLVVVATTAYPYGRGEQFLTAELVAWAAAGARVVLLPLTTTGAARPLPTGVEVDDAMARRWQARATVAAALAAAPTDLRLRRELADLRRRKALTRRTAVTAVKAVAQARALEAALMDVARRRGRIDVAYTYWLKPFTVGAVAARERGAVRRVVSRAHGSDLYEQARPDAYNPLVRTGATGVDALLPISDGGRAYALERYGFAADAVHTARLGVAVPPAAQCAPASTDGRLRVLSISSMTRLKRLDLLVEALALVAERGVPVSWRHLGDGPLRADLEALVASRLAPLGVDVDLAGQIDHDRLLASLAETTDLMVNTSSSEGVPVSIMEAQAHGIPCLATDVGATGEVVPADLLVPADVTASALAARIVEVVDDVRSPRRRAEVREHVAQRFDAARNHEAFVASVLDLAR